MLTTGEKAAAQQRRLDCNHLHSQELLLDRVRQPRVLVDVVEDHADDIDSNLVEWRAFVLDSREQIGMDAALHE